MPSYLKYIYTISSQLKLATLIGMGNITVDDCSVEIPVSVCRYLSCRACGDFSMTSAAFVRAPEAFFSPSAAITFALASLAASASAGSKDLAVKIFLIS